MSTADGLSAFGVEHGQVEKGLTEVTQKARLVGRTVKQGAKLQRLHNKKALTQAGYPTSMGGNMKESFKAGIKGGGQSYTTGHKAARAAGRTRFKADVEDIKRGAKPGRRIVDPAMGQQMTAGIHRRLSQIDRRLG